MGIRIQKKRLEDPWVRHTTSLLNKVSLIPGHAGILGMILVGSFPMDFYRSSEQWVRLSSAKIPFIRMSAGKCVRSVHFLLPQKLQVL